LIYIWCCGKAESSGEGRSSWNSLASGVEGAGVDLKAVQEAVVKKGVQLYSKALYNHQ
jgi:hypothetical protein